LNSQINNKNTDIFGVSAIVAPPGGPHHEKAMSFMSKALHGFWRHGVAGGNRRDITALKSDSNGITTL